VCAPAFSLFKINKSLKRKKRRQDKPERQKAFPEPIAAIERVPLMDLGNVNWKLSRKDSSFQIP